MGEHVAGVYRLLTGQAKGESCRGFNVVLGGVDGVDHDEVGGGAGVKGEGALLTDAKFPTVGARAVRAVWVHDSEGSAGCRGDDGDGWKLGHDISGESDAEGGTGGRGNEGDSGDEI